MKKSPVLYKALVIGVIVLFVGVAVQPAIAKMETQEYTLITPNILGIKKQQICLTSEQSVKLDSIFDDLHTKLESIESVEETKRLYKRTIDTLYKNDLLSKSDAFLTKKLLFSSIVDRFYSVLNKKINIDTDIEISNCWITGETDRSFYLRPIQHLISITRPNTTAGYYKTIKRSSKVSFADISFGYRVEWEMGSKSYWSNGWLSTIDDNNGVKYLTGTFRGGLSKIQANTIADHYTFFLGVYFFIGIGYNNLTPREKDYFIGRSWCVDIYEK